MDLGLSGKIAIVTGGAKGIGAGICRCLVQEGATVVVNTHSNDEMSQAFCAELAEVGNVLAIQGDVSKEDDVSAIFKSAVDAFGRIDILVNNAGVTDGYPIDKMTLAQWRRVVDTNLTGTFLMCREMVRLCRKSKERRSHRKHPIQSGGILHHKGEDGLQCQQGGRIGIY